MDTQRIIKLLKSMKQIVFTSEEDLHLSKAILDIEKGMHPVDALKLHGIIIKKE